MENTKKILVVEDDVDLRKALVSRLGSSNYEVFQAADGEEAITIILDQKPDLVLLDLLLPKLDGFQVLEKIRSILEKSGKTMKNAENSENYLPIQIFQIFLHE